MTLPRGDTQTQVGPHFEASIFADNVFIHDRLSPAKFSGVPSRDNKALLFNGPKLKKKKNLCSFVSQASKMYFSSHLFSIVLRGQWDIRGFDHVSKGPGRDWTA